MEKKKTKNKKPAEPEISTDDENSDERKTEGFPQDVDFKKFLGCG